MFCQTDLFETKPREESILDTPALIDRIACVSTRPRYAFLVLQLIAEAAAETGSAGPYVREGAQRVNIRDWLADALIPMAQRDSRRKAIVRAIQSQLAEEKKLPADPVEADALVDAAVRERVRRSGRCNVSRAVSDLVRAGLVRRHYQGFRVNHHNRGAQREVVYSITAQAAASLARGRPGVRALSAR